MKKTILVIGAIAAAAFGQTAHAADGTINFFGELVAQTCTIDVNGTVTPAAAMVMLPKVSTGKLASSGQTTGTTGFTIGLKNCAGPAKSASAFFESGTTVDPATGNLKNTVAAGGGPATNVQLQLIDITGNKLIRAGDSIQHTATAKVTLDASGNANLPYAVQYYATGVTTAGKVASQVLYSIDYQ